MTEQKAVSTIKELAMSFLALVIAIIFTVIAFGIAKWALDFFGFPGGDVVTAAAIIAVAIILGPTIAAFAKEILLASFFYFSSFWAHYWEKSIPSWKRTLV